MHSLLLSGIVVTVALLMPSPARAEEPRRSQEELASEEAMEALEPQETEYAKRSKGAMVTGIVLTSIGGSALIGGFFFTLVNGLAESGSETAETAGAVIMGSGALGILVGVPLIIYGAQDDTSRYDTGAEPRVQLAISPTAVGSQGSF